MGSKGQADNDVIKEYIEELKVSKSKFLNIIISIDKMILDATYVLD